MIEPPLLLLVEDELRMARVLQSGLAEEGFEVRWAGTGEDALALVALTSPRLVVLDVMLPGIDGFETCRRLRASGCWVPVLMLSARADIQDRVRGLDSGADDYLAKPFSFTELLARLRAMSRRGERERAAEIVAGPLRLDPSGHRVWCLGQRVELSAREFALLEAFMRRPGEAVSRQWLLEQAWDIAYEQRSNVVDVYVKYLRSKLDEPFAITLIETVRGVGYRLTAEDSP